MQSSNQHSYIAQLHHLESRGHQAVLVILALPVALGHLEVQNCREHLESLESLEVPEVPLAREFRLARPFLGGL